MSFSIFALWRLARAGFDVPPWFVVTSSAEALGAPAWRTIARHLLPNAAGPLLVAATLGVGDVILLEAGLSFLGLGVQPPTPSWGGMVLDARPLIVTAPWTAIFPGAAITLAVTGAQLLSEGARDALDPRLSRLPG